MSRAVRFRTPKLRSGATFAQAIDAMRGGAVLTLEFFSGQPRWELGGREVAVEVVTLLLAAR